ncbi:MAG: hypothetical protein KIS72_01515 [Luteimonas sp.]|nr:hypothetical protein [Luteimonas sp.]
MRVAIVLLALALPTGCASTYEPAADAGSPFPSWCADIARQQRDMPSPRDGSSYGVGLPPECTEATSVPLFPGRAPDPPPA